MWKVYDESRLKELFIEGLHHLILFSMRNHWRANKRSTLQNLARYATSLFKLPEGSRSSCITVQADSHSLQKPLKNANRGNRLTLAMTVANERHSKSSLSLGGPSSKPLDRSKCQTNSPKMSIALQGHVASISQQVQAPLQYASRSPTCSGYYCLCSNARHVMKACPLIQLKLVLFLFLQRESNKAITFERKSNTTFRERPYYRGAPGPSAYRPDSLVPSLSNKTSPTFSRHRGSISKTMTQKN